MWHGPYFLGETVQDGSCGAVRFKTSLGDIALGFRIGKLSCFSVCTPEAVGCSEGHGLVPFFEVALW